VKLSNRLKKLEAAVPKCDGRYSRIVDPDYEPTAEDRCRICGGYHLLVVEEVIVESRDEAQRWRAQNGGAR
jgi:hypothetical protein